MPPKKNTVKDKGKKKKGGKNDGKNEEMKVEELYKRSVQEVDILKGSLAERKIYARHTRVAEEIMRDGMLKAKKMVEEEKDKRTCIAGDLTRQYMTMQFQLETKVEYLETQVLQLQETLGNTIKKLTEVEEERDLIQAKREEEVDNLEVKLKSMEKSYETILQDVFDSLAVKMDAARQKWDMESHLMEKEALDILSEFGKGLRPTTPSTFT